MNTRAFLLASLISGVVMGLLGGLPIISLANCLLCLWVWLFAMLAVLFYQRLEGSRPRVSPGQGALLGLVSGVIGAVIVFLLSLLTRGRATQAIADMLATSGIDLPSGVLASGLSIVSFFFDLVLYAIFGAIGGLIGSAVFKGRPAAPAVSNYAVPPAPPSPEPIPAPSPSPIEPVQMIEPTPVMPDVVEPAPPETKAPDEAEPPAG